MTPACTLPVVPTGKVAALTRITVVPPATVTGGKPPAVSLPLMTLLRLLSVTQAMEVL